MNQPNPLFLETATAIGARLCRDAVWAGDRCNWLGDSMEFVGNAWTVVHRAFGADLYGGTSGIAFFLARLYSLTHERLFRTTAEGAIRQSLSRLDDFSPMARIGFYSGVTGVAYALVQLGKAYESERYIDKALQLLEELLKDDPSQQGLDVVSGSAGAIPVLLALHRDYAQPFLLDLALRHGQHLLDTARQSEIGWSWDTLNMRAEHDLTGFSHGTAGIAWALLELCHATGQTRFQAAAEQAFRYERHWFSPEHENWPDFRNLYDPTMGGQTPIYTVTWCHGAPGIGLSRLRAYQLSGADVYRQEAEAALRTTVAMLGMAAYPGQGNFSLCHGFAGNAELLLYASRVLGNGEYRSLAEQVGRWGIEQCEKQGAPWPCGVTGGGETPNLMLGLAGIGYFYLRLHDPLHIPPVVIMTPEADQPSDNPHS